NGNGLGLAISRRIALLLGGDVRFIEAENGGAIFTLWLPSKRRQPDGAGIEAKREEVWSTAP
ncbi:MAG TPA: ATP-binding protein, partial [Gemmatimonadaceae bacterium]|nr:ATP-binding protein [Gemmatimonadaceae bacterium]